MSTVNIAGLDKAEVLAALYNRAKPQGMGFLHYDPTPLTADDVRPFTNIPYYDYVKGRVMKIDISKDEMDTSGYNRDNGLRAAEEVIEILRVGLPASNAIIAALHEQSTKESAEDVKSRLTERSGVIREADGSTTFHIGLSDMAHHLEPKLDAVLGEQT